jgi:chaperonin GroEL (HSP60 family)
VFFNSHLSTGGGVALLYATKELDKISTANEDEKIGVQIIKNALKVILYPVDPISPCTQLSVFTL